MDDILSQEQLESVLRESELPVMVFFEARWSPPCVKMKGLVYAFKDEYHGRLKVVKVNLDGQNNRDIAEKCKITGIPTLIIFKNGEAVGDPQVGQAERAQLDAFVKKRI